MQSIQHNNGNSATQTYIRNVSFCKWDINVISLLFVKNYDGFSTAEWTGIVRRYLGHRKWCSKSVPIEKFIGTAASPSFLPLLSQLPSWFSCTNIDLFHWSTLKIHCYENKGQSPLNALKGCPSWYCPLRN